MSVTPLSDLDLTPVPFGSAVADARRNTVDLACHAERPATREWGLA
jgi:hypothetical protein